MSSLENEDCHESTMQPRNVYGSTVPPSSGRPFWIVSDDGASPMVKFCWNVEPDTSVEVPAPRHACHSRPMPLLIASMVISPAPCEDVTTRRVERATREPTRRP